VQEEPANTCNFKHNCFFLVTNRKVHDLFTLMTPPHIPRSLPHPFSCLQSPFSVLLSPFSPSPLHFIQLSQKDRFCCKTVFGNDGNRIKAPGDIQRNIQFGQVFFILFKYNFPNRVAYFNPATRYWALCF